MKQTASTLPPFSRISKALLLSSLFMMPAHAEDIFWFDQKPKEADPIASIVNAAGPVSSNLEIAEVSPTLLSESVKIDLSKQAIEGHNWPLANKLLPLIEGDDEWVAYGQALANSQQGLFETAYNFAQRIENKTSPFFVPAQKLKNGLSLRLAEQSQNKGDYETAASWLRAVQDTYSNNSQRHYYNRLVEKQNNYMFPERLGTKPFSRPLRVSLLLPLSGPLQEVGESMLKAAQIAMFEHSPRAMLLYPQDTQGTRAGSSQAMQRALKDRTDIVLGPLLAENTQNIAYMAEDARIPVISFSSDKRVANRNTFLMSHIPAQQAREAARYAFRQGKRKIAALVPSGLYGQEVFRAFEDEVNKLGGQVVVQSQFNPKDTDHTKALETLVNMAEARKILKEQRQALEDEYNLLGSAMSDEKLAELEELRKQPPQPIIRFDALFIPAPGQMMPLIASQLAYYDIEAKNVLLLGTSQWADKKILQGRAEYVRGGRFISPSVEKTEAFDALYTEAYSEKPHALAPLAYDSVKMISSLFAEDPSNPLYIRQGLTRGEGFSGYSGTFRFENNGIPARAYDTVRVTSRQFVVEEKAADILPPPLPQPVDPRDKKEDFFKFW